MGETWIPLRQRTVVVRILTGRDAGRTVEVPGRRIHVGTAPHNDVVLSDRTVSRRHLLVERSVRGLVVRDLGSTNGTWLDGSPVREGFASPDSVVTLGTVDLEFRSGWASPDPGQEGRVGTLGAVSSVGRRFLAALRAACEDGGPIAVWGEHGSGRRTAVEAAARGPLLLVADGRRGTVSSPGPDEVGDGVEVLVVEPWLLGRRRQVELAGLLERFGSERRIWSLWTRDPAEVSDGHCMDRRLGEFLSQTVVAVPPVRLRWEDVDSLLDEWVTERAGRPAPRWLHDWVRRLPWPGNWPEVREALEGLWAAGRVFVLWPEGELDPGREDLGSFGAWKDSWVRAGDHLFVRWVLTRSRGNVSQGARMAGMDRKHLARLARRFGLKARGRGRPSVREARGRGGEGGRPHSPPEGTQAS